METFNAQIWTKWNQSEEKFHRRLQQHEKALNLIEVSCLFSSQIEKLLGKKKYFLNFPDKHSIPLKAHKSLFKVSVEAMPTCYHPK